MQLLQSVTDLRNYVGQQRKAGKTISFVPTMGALHDGHLELVRQGLARTDVCIPYIFLNPKQFAAGEDLAKYPKTLDADLEKLRGVNASAVYLPTADDVYPDGFVTKVSLGGVALPLEGEFRPVMFDGVATVVSKMLLRCLPDVALFGEKDYQQLQVIKQMVRDLDIPVEIVGVPTKRDENGLALSSRNTYLSEYEYRVAIDLNKTLFGMADAIRGGQPIPAADERAKARLMQSGFASVDYITARDARTLQAPEEGADIRLLAAAWLGKTRLIDNIPL